MRMLFIVNDSDGGKRGIRTPGASQLNGFQDRRNRPLCHLSGGKNITDILLFQFCGAYYVSILHDKHTRGVRERNARSFFGPAESRMRKIRIGSGIDCKKIAEQRKEAAVLCRML